MKKKVLIGIVLTVLVLLIAGVVWFIRKNLTFSTARCVVTKQNYMMVLDDSPISMHNRSGNEELFADLHTGDKVLVMHDGIAESYPGQTGVYFCIRLKEGSSADIPVQVLEALESLGYIIN